MISLPEPYPLNYQVVFHVCKLFMLQYHKSVGYMPDFGFSIAGNFLNS